MNQQTQHSGRNARAITPMRSLADLGHEGSYRIAAPTPSSTFPVDPSWYEKYWYGDRLPSRWGLLANALRRLSSEVHRVGDIMRRANSYPTSIFARLTGTTGTVPSSGDGAGGQREFSLELTAASSANSH